MDLTETMDVPADVVRGAGQPVAMLVRGNGLRALGVVDGDVVIIDTFNRAPRRGEIIAARLNGVLTLRAYLADDEVIRLGWADGSLFQRLAVRPTDRLEVLGVFVSLLGYGTRRWQDTSDG
jgi:SOS-response transcriptional repressor LexA